MSANKTQERMVFLGVRIPYHLKAIMQKYVYMDVHKDISELTRDAIREKIARACTVRHIGDQTCMWWNSARAKDSAWPRSAGD